jgi:hypothetical protein
MAMAYRAFIIKDIELFTAFDGIPDQALAADEFGIHQVGTVGLAHGTKGRVAHVFHGRQQQRKFR